MVSLAEWMLFDSGNPLVNDDAKSCPLDDFLIFHPRFVVLRPLPASAYFVRQDRFYINSNVRPGCPFPNRTIRPGAIIELPQLGGLHHGHERVEA